MEPLKLLIKELLNERIEKRGKKYFVVSHKTNKVIGKKDGYGSKRGAVRALLGMTSRGNFYTLGRLEQRRRIRKYLKTH